jgi:hypothetical protein
MPVSVQRYLFIVCTGTLKRTSPELQARIRRWEEEVKAEDLKLINIWLHIPFLGILFFGSRFLLPTYYFLLDFLLFAWTAWAGFAWRAAGWGLFLNAAHPENRELLYHLWGLAWRTANGTASEDDYFEIRPAGGAFIFEYWHISVPFISLNAVRPALNYQTVSRSDLLSDYNMPRRNAWIIVQNPLF